MRIDVSGHQFQFPTVCACCSGSADTELTISASKTTGKRVIHTKTHAWGIPYCAGCVSHVRAAEGARVAAGVLGFLSLVVGGILCYLTTPFLGIPIGVLGLVATAILHSKQMAQARAMCSAGCSCVGKSAVYLGWHGTLHQFEITSRAFAFDFMVANQRKLVNLSPEARNLLSSKGSNSNPNASRSPRRYMS